jgi:tripartite-type tricarboxylate transporter receptor subunit TctC
LLDVPSAKEAGDPEYQLSIWSAMLAPKGTPKDILAKLIGALGKTLDDPAVAKRLADLGGAVPPPAERGPAHFEAVLKADIARWQPVLKAAMPEPK